MVLKKSTNNLIKILRNRLRPLDSTFKHNYEKWKKRSPKISHACVPLKGQCHKIFCFWFFWWISLPPARSIALGPFQFFSKIRGDIRKSKFATGVNDTGVNVTGGKFFYQFRWCCWYLWQICHWCQWYRRQICHWCQRRQWQIATGINDTSGKFATGVNDTSGK